MKPTYEQLEKKVKNHRIMWLVFLFFCILDIFAWSAKMDQVEKLKTENAKEKSKREYAEQRFIDALCLPRLD